jgi:molecular chaperone IbpA
MEDVAMRTFDPAPLWRSTIGFDRLVELLDQSAQWSANDTYFPYNIERAGDWFRPLAACCAAEYGIMSTSARARLLVLEVLRPEFRETSWREFAGH